MLPTQTQLHGSRWFMPPSFDYSMKHSFMWPHPPHAMAQPNLSHVAAEAATAAHMPGGAHIPPTHTITHGWYGRGYPGRYTGRGGGARRLIWVSRVARKA
jgi:hypothetical protein